MIKLAVGVRDASELRDWQRQRFSGPPMHHTRQRPRRADEIIDGGSLYWVIAGTALLRQRIVDIATATRPDGSACAALVFDPALISVRPRPVRAFQGWRYLEPADAPPDLGANDAEAGMPPAMAARLRGLGLI